MVDIKVEYELLLERIKSLAQNAPTELYNELYPEKLGEKIAMQAPELRLIAIAKFEGMGIVLNRLGADINKLNTMIEEEADKISVGQY